MMASYPGTLHYDGFYQVIQFIDQKYSNKHSVLMTFFMKLCFELSDKLGKGANEGVFIYCLFQTFFLLLALSFLFVELYKKSKITSLLFAIHVLVIPMHKLMAISTTKDTFFSVLYALIIIDTHHILNLQEKKKHIGFRKLFQYLCENALACFFTHNYFFSFVIFILLVLLIYRGERKGIACWFILFLLTYNCYTNLLLPVLDIEGTDKSTKMVVPFQQIVRTYNRNEDIPLYYKDRIFSIWGGEKLNSYSPYLSDYAMLKDDIWLKNKKVILDTWLHLGLRYPKTYMDSFLLNNYEFWYPYASYPKPGWNPGYFYYTCRDIRDLYPYNDVIGEKNRDWWHTYNKPMGFKTIKDRMECFNDRYANFHYNDTYTIPLIHGCGLYFIIILLCVIAGSIMRYKSLLVEISLSLLLIGTFLCGPAVLVRYMYPMILASFYYLALIINKLSDIFRNK